MGFAPARNYNLNTHTGPSFPFRNRLARWCWNLVYSILFRTSPRPFHRWRSCLLRLFGAKIGANCHIYPNAKIWAPWNLVCGDSIGVADDAELYNPDKIEIGNFGVISQGAYLCTASHDYTKSGFPLIAMPIKIGAKAWVSARAIVLMGVRIGEGAVIGAGSVVTKEMPPWTVCAGNPCRVLKEIYVRE